MSRIPSLLPVRPLPRRLLGGALALGVAVACTSSTESTGAEPVAVNVVADAHAGHGNPNAGPLTARQVVQIARVREATAKFADIEVARAAGYALQFPAGCATTGGPEGAQGFHWLNEGLVDDKTELLEPELVMYEPQADGSMVLVGVDYIIPFAAWKHKSPPTLLGVEFGRNEPLGVYALHIWAQRENPVSPFAPWNPNVSCAFAAAAP